MNNGFSSLTTPSINGLRSLNNMDEITSVDLNATNFTCPNMIGNFFSIETIEATDVQVDQELELTSSGYITIGKGTIDEITITDTEVGFLDGVTSNIQAQLDAIDTDLGGLSSDVGTNTSNISTNTSNISTNTSNISTNTSNISTNTSNISTNTSNISTNTSDILTNASDISTNASNISTLEDKTQNQEGYSTYTKFLNNIDIDCLIGGDGVNIYDISSSGKCVYQGYTGGTTKQFHLGVTDGTNTELTATNNLNLYGTSMFFSTNDGSDIQINKGNLLMDGYIALGNNPIIMNGETQNYCFTDVRKTQQETNTTNISTLETNTQYITTSGGDTNIASDIDISYNRLNCGSVKFYNSSTGATTTIGQTNPSNSTYHITNYDGGIYAYADGNVTLVSNTGNIKMNGTVEFDSDGSLQNTAFTDAKDTQLSTLEDITQNQSTTGTITEFAGHIKTTTDNSKVQTSYVSAYNYSTSQQCGRIGNLNDSGNYFHIYSNSTSTGRISINSFGNDIWVNAGVFWLRDCDIKFSDNTTQGTAFTNAKDTQLSTNTSDISSLQSAVSPTGSVIAFAGSSAPTGWLLCNGAEVSKTTYADLFAVIGTTYNSTGGRTGPSTGNFCLPDLRQCMIMGVGGNDNYTQKINWYSVAKTLGQFSEMSVQGHGHFYDKSGSESAATGVPTTTVGSNSSSSTQTGGTVYDDGTSFTDAITQPNNVGMNYIIKT